MEHSSFEVTGQGPDVEVETGERREQWFRFGPWIFDVTEGQAIVAASPRERRSMPVEPWARFYGLAERTSGSVPLFGNRDLDTDYALTTDLRAPVLVATLRNQAGDEFPLLVDGTHRLYRAHVEGVERLSADVLTVEETLTIREDGFIGGFGKTGSGAE